MLGRNPFASLNQNLAVFVQQVKLGRFAFQTLGHQISLYTVFGEVIVFFVVEHLQHLFVVVAQSTQQNGYRHFAATVDTEIQQIFMIEFKIQP